MRISTSNAYDATVETLTRRQLELTESQHQLTTGKRVAKASDDPAAAARAERALASMGRSDTSLRSVEASKSVLLQTESALGDAGSLMQLAREALVAAGNATYADADRKGLADRLRGLRNDLLAVANRSDGAGSYLFEGQGGSQPPFVDTPAGVQYRALSGALTTDAGTALPLTTDGAQTWLTARTGNGSFETLAGGMVTAATIDSGRVVDPSALTGSTYTLQFSVAGTTTTYAVLKDGAPTAVTAAPYAAGQAIQLDGMAVTIAGKPAGGDQFQILPSTPSLSVFDVLDKAVTDLSTTLRTGSQIAQSNADNLRNMDAVMGNVQAARSLAGQVLNRIDGESDRLDAQHLASETVRSKAEDLDMVQAYSSFQNQQTGYEAALKSYSMVQRMSLFQYLNG
jgi:flagellar hook-associated protein 3 FlgL